jgi:hypothetical protein
MNNVLAKNAWERGHQRANRLLRPELQVQHFPRSTTNTNSLPGDGDRTGTTS